MARRHRFLVAAVLSLGGTAAAAAPLAFSRADFTSYDGARAVVAADFDRDGLIDVAHANTARNSVTVLLNNGGVSLTRTFDVVVDAGPFGLAAADLDRDGIVDLAVANADGDSITVLTGRGDGSFTRARDIPAPGRGPRGIAAADMNADGRMDIVYAGYASRSVHVLNGDGAGRFTEGASVAGLPAGPQDVAAADLNRDGRLDVAIACDAACGLQILYAGGSRTFTRRAVTGATYLSGVAVADIDGDGWLDVAVSSTRSTASIFLGGAAGPTHHRSYAVGASPRDVALADLNADGRPDLVTANRSAATVSVLAGSTQGTFTGRQDLPAGTGSRTVALADFDANGLVDIAAGNEYARAVTLLPNVTSPGRAGFRFGSLTIPSAQPLLAAKDARMAPGPPSLAASDFNHDGKVDFVAPAIAANGTPGVAVMLRDGATRALAGRGAYAGVLTADVNGDGNADVVQYSVNGLFSTHLGDGTGAFPVRVATDGGMDVTHCAAGDMDRNGTIDLACGGWPGVQVLLGNRKGGFRPAAANTFEGAGSMHVAVADMNRDGALDVVGSAMIHFGDGTGSLPEHVSFADLGGGFQTADYMAVADLNHDGFADLVSGGGQDGIGVRLGGPNGFVGEPDGYYTTDYWEGLAIADVTLDGQPDIVVNASLMGESAGIVVVLEGKGDGTFAGSGFALAAGEVLAMDVTADGLPDLVSYDTRGVHVLTGERNGVNHPPLVPDYAITLTAPCAPLAANASDPDQHALFFEWLDAAGETVGWGSGAYTHLDVCLEPGTYQYRRTARDGRGGSVTGTVRVTVVRSTEIVLHVAEIASGFGTWRRVPDPTAAGGVRLYDPDRNAPRLSQPAALTENSVRLVFSPDPTMTYKLWVRLKAERDSYANDSIWVQFGRATNVAGEPVYRIGTTSGLAVNLEECAACGVSGWGWEDDGWGAVNRNGVLLRFPEGWLEEISIQTREDGVSIDQIVLSAEKHLETRPGTAKDDTTILAPTYSYSYR